MTYTAPQSSQTRGHHHIQLFHFEQSRRRAAQHARMQKQVRQVDEPESMPSVSDNPTPTPIPSRSAPVFSSGSVSDLPSLSSSRPLTSSAPSLSMSESEPSLSSQPPSISDPGPSHSQPSGPSHSPPSKPPPSRPPPSHHHPSHTSHTHPTTPPYTPPPSLPPSQSPSDDPPASPSESAFEPPPSASFPDDPSSYPTFPPSSSSPPPLTEPPPPPPSLPPSPSSSTSDGSSSHSMTITGVLGTETSHENSFSRSTGSIIGVALGGLGFITLVGLGAFFLVRRYRRRHLANRFSGIHILPTHPVPKRQRSMVLFEDDDDMDADAGSGSGHASGTSETGMRGISGIVAALGIGDDPRPGMSIRGYSSPLSSDENSGGGGGYGGSSSRGGGGSSGGILLPITPTTTRTQRMSIGEPPDSASIYSDPPPTPVFPPSSYNYNYQASNGGHSSGEHGSSSLGHSYSSHGHGGGYTGNGASGSGNGMASRARAHTPPPTVALGGSFRPKSPTPPSPTRSSSAEGEKERPMSFFNRLRGGRRSTGGGSGGGGVGVPSMDSMTGRASPSVPNIVVSSASTPSPTIRGRPGFKGPHHISLNDIPSFEQQQQQQHAFPSTEPHELRPRQPPWTPYDLPPAPALTTPLPYTFPYPPYPYTNDHLDTPGFEPAPMGLLRSVPQEAGSRTSLGDHVDYTRPTLGVVFNRMESTTTVSGSVMTMRSGLTGRGEDGHSVS